MPELHINICVSRNREEIWIFIPEKQLHVKSGYTETSYGDRMAATVFVAKAMAAAYEKSGKTIFLQFSDACAQPYEDYIAGKEPELILIDHHADL